MMIKNVSFYVIAEPAKRAHTYAALRESYLNKARKDSPPALKTYPGNPCLHF